MQAVNYNNYTIRILDADYQKDNDCSSFPRYPSEYWTSNFSIWQHNNNRSLSRYIYITTPVVILKCKKRVNSSLYKEIASFCEYSHSSDFYYYLVNAKSMRASDMEMSCSTEQKALISSDWLINKNASVDIRNQLALGFELTWVPEGCYITDSNGIRCGYSGKMFLLN